MDGDAADRLALNLRTLLVCIQTGCVPWCSSDRCITDVDLLTYDGFHSNDQIM